MRQLTACVLAWCICGFAPPAAHAEQGQEQALALIKRAIRAQGGTARLAQFQTYERTARGKQFLTNQEFDFTTTLIVAFPDRLHDTITVMAQNNKVQLVQALNGDKAWRIADGKTTPLSKEETGDLREELYLMRLTTLLPLKEAGFELKVLPDIKVDGRLAHVVLAAHKGHAPARLFFDAGTHLLVKTEHRARQATLTVVKEYRLSNYKTFDGLKLPTRQIEYTNGNKAGELTITGYKFLEKPDPKLFEQPKE